MLLANALARFLTALRSGENSIASEIVFCLDYSNEAILLSTYYQLVFFHTVNALDQTWLMAASQFNSLSVAPCPETIFPLTNICSNDSSPEKVNLLFGGKSLNLVILSLLKETKQSLLLFSFVLQFTGPMKGKLSFFLSYAKLKNDLPMTLH